jgi:hypothetical protein
MPIVIPNNKLVKPAHEFDSKPGVAKEAMLDAGPVSISTTGFHESGAALFEYADGANNEGYIGMLIVGGSIGAGVAALRNTIIGNFTGVLPGKEVFLGQDGQLTQDVVTADAPAAGPTLAESAGAGVLAAGTYTVGFSYVDADGETLLSPTTDVTIVANKQIDVTAVTPLPAGVTAVRWYMSIAPGSDTLRRVAENNGAAFSINALPAGNAALPLESVAVAGSRRVGVGFTPHLIAFD